MKRPSPLAIVLAALVLFGAGLGIFVAVDSGGKAAPGPVVANISPTLSLPADSKLPGDFFGIVSEDAFANPGAYRTATLNRLARIGVGIVRQTFDWAAIERAPDQYDFTTYDSFVGSLAIRRMTVLPVLLDPPPFRSSKPKTGAAAGTYPPADYADMGRFAATLVRRYGPRGRFWKLHPELPKVPIRAWQVWNEPSLPAYWPAGPDPAQYTRLLEVVGHQIKRFDHRAEVVTAGIPDSRLGIPFSDFVKGMYRAGARGSFDSLAIHPYSRDATGVAAAVEDARQIMDANGDRRSDIWVTELGWADAGPASSFTVGASGQAERISSVFRTLVRLRHQARLRGVVYFGWRDGAPYAPAFKDFWGLHTGLVDIKGNPKPALSAFAGAVATLRRQG